MTEPLFRATEQGAPARRIVPARKLTGVAAGLFQATGRHFETQAVDQLALTFEGIGGDIHAGLTRRSGAREPWYRRGTEIRNERQLTLVAGEELTLIAAGMGLSELRPEWIGANLLVTGVPDFSMLPPGTLLFLAGGATLKIDAQNAPCRLAGRQVALRASMADRLAGELLFPKAAKRLRGLTAWVEKPGLVCRGETVSLRVPDQWIY